ISSIEHATRTRGLEIAESFGHAPRLRSIALANAIPRNDTNNFAYLLKKKCERRLGLVISICACIN
ncbi:MAG: hypothetical protein AAF208_14565, partial [Cyanobacteria bacterium P01_A01_bin.45]